jgi:hypothetical protein
MDRESDWTEAPRPEEPRPAATLAPSLKAGWWSWFARVRILVMIDGRITEDPHEDFSLDLVLDTLRDTSIAWWVRFVVDVVRRDGSTKIRLTDINIDDYDQIWFFGDNPGEKSNDPSVGDDESNKPEYVPLNDQELELLAPWMRRGGGVFATGDHALLGSSMCHRIPRVRTMRKWTRSQGVPSFGDEDRHETLQHYEGGLNSWEGDRWPQRIFPVWQRSGNRPITFGDHPHPLLCGRDGVIQHFPDHMHEGGVIEDADVKLNLPLSIGGYSGVEYPTVGGVQARPHVIAHGLTTNPESNPVRFAMISVYDGEEAHVGRVVVDSTWHHWFNMNLLGFRDQAPGFYSGMQDYYRNVAMWLSSPEKRAAMLFWAAWGGVVGTQPGLLSKVLGVWGIGERVVDVIGRSAPQCVVSDLVAAFMKAPMTARPRGPNKYPRVPAVPIDEMMNQAVVGGIGFGLVDLAHEYRLDEIRGRKRELEEAKLREGALAGLAEGKRALLAALDDLGSEVAEVRAAIDERFDEGRHQDHLVDGEGPASE